MNNKLKPQSDRDIFALDIGTRNVVAMLMRFEDGVYRVLGAASAAHETRSMSDGQIEDIDLTARTVDTVRRELEEQVGISLSRVAIAAAGRALVTRRSTAVQNIDPSAPVSDEMIHALELEAVTTAQDELSEESGSSDGSRAYYCVGHTVVRYMLDGYRIQTLAGHKGSQISAELIAAFLPSVVVESLYSVVDRCGLTAHSMTLEPIAAMNVIIPPELRLINIALADIGAGTSDIAISEGGSITAYSMATMAGDEITEDIIGQYLVDFGTAERMKLSLSEEEISYTDILGLEHTISGEELSHSLEDATERLAACISENILTANGKAPAAVMLVGGGSLIPSLPEKVANSLNIPAQRVAVGGKNLRIKLDIPGCTVLPPELVTPVGIGITACMHTGYDFSVVTLNSKRLRIFDTKRINCAQMLLQAGYKTPQIIGRSGRGLSFTVNGERRNIRGDAGIPAQITVNGRTASLEYIVKPGDSIVFVPAVSGRNASVTVAEIIGGNTGHITIDGEEYPFGTVVEVNGHEVTPDYCIQSFDSVTVTHVDTIGAMSELTGYILYRNGYEVSPDEELFDGDVLSSRGAANEDMPVKAENTVDIAAADNIPTEDARIVEGKAPASQAAPSVQSAVPSAPSAVPTDMSIILNGRPLALESRRDLMPHTFLELMALADIDMSLAPPSGNMILSINGRNASFQDELHEGDDIIIRWDDK